MTPKQRVRRRFPTATAHYSRTERCWFVWTTPSPTGAQDMLSRDANVVRAWRLAAR